VEKWTFFELTPVCWNPEEYGSKSDSNIWKNKPQDHQQSINNLHFYTVVHNSTGNVWYGLVSWNMGFWDADDVSLKFWLLIYRKQWKISRDVNGRFSLKMAIFHVFLGGNITTWFGSYPGFCSFLRTNLCLPVKKHKLYTYIYISLYIYMYIIVYDSL
jgi:hypothetical protein